MPGPPATSEGSSARGCASRAGGAGAGAQARARRPSWPRSAARCAGPTCSSPTRSGPALEGVDVAYYLVHSMGRGSDGDFAERDKDGAENFAAAAAAAGVRRIVYLGGLGEGSEHLASRHATAETLRAGDGPGHLLPRRRRDRRRQRVLPHRLLPGQAPAADGDSALGHDPDPADRDRRRRLLPRRRRGPRLRRSIARSRSAAPTSPPTAA